MATQHFLYKNSQVAYLRFGTGSKVAICFHGYGEKADTFLFLGKYAGDQFTFLAIDLPLHGATKWMENNDFTANELEDIIKKIFEKEGFSTLSSGNPVTLIGYSLGGRAALSLYQIIPGKINKLLLMAPDGLKLNFWYWLATQTLLGNRLFAFTMKYPYWYFALLKIFNQLKMVNNSIYKFAHYHINDAQVRDELYLRWTTFRKLKPDLREIKLLINKHQTQVRLVYGKHDRIIRYTRGEGFKKGIENHCSLSIIPAGHQVLHEKHVKDILPALLH